MDESIRALDSHLAILGTRERATVVLKLDNRCGSLAGHVVNSILVSKPVGALDGIVHVPPPVVFVHVTKGSVDTTLCGDSVTPGREKLRYTGSVEAGLGQTEGGAKTGTTGTDNDRIVLVVLIATNEIVS